MSCATRSDEYTSREAMPLPSEKWLSSVKRWNRSSKVFSMSRYLSATSLTQLTRPICTPSPLSPTDSFSVLAEATR